MKVLDWRKSGLKADRKAALRMAIDSAKIDPFHTSFEGSGKLNMDDLKRCAEKTIAKFIKSPW